MVYYTHFYWDYKYYFIFLFQHILKIVDGVLTIATLCRFRFELERHFNIWWMVRLTVKEELMSDSEKED